uniref:Uncharacterized protein n=1 Tax=Gorilla gorilla gorilla TaxID=9595 RepID=A0A2I2YX01_GORGO
MNAGPGCEPCTKRPRWGAATTSPAASDARSFPSRQRRVLDPKDAHVQFRVPPSSPACVPGQAGQHRGSATSAIDVRNSDEQSLTGRKMAGDSTTCLLLQV